MYDSVVFCQIVRTVMILLKGHPCSPCTAAASIIMLGPKSMFIRGGVAVLIEKIGDHR